MSRECTACGAMIPEGAEVCPACGALVLDHPLEEESVTPEVSDPVAEVPETPVDIPEETAEPEMPTEEAAVPPVFGEDPEPPAEEKPLRPASRTMPQKGTSAGAKPVKRRRPPENEKNMNNTRRKKKRHMKKSSAAVIGVLIGLIIALLVVGIGVILMLRQLGFFTPMSDEQLLSMTQQAASTVETDNATQANPQEETVAEPEQASVVEASAEEEEPVYDPAADLESLVLTSEDNIYLYSRGETAEIPYEIQPEDLADYIEWTSSDETIAIAENGEIQARRGGECDITGTLGETAVTVHVICEFEVSETVLDMNMEDITLNNEGQTAELYIDYDLDDYYVENTVWESSDPDVATVNEKGVVTAVSDGTAVITASIDEYSASCIVRCVGVSGNRGYNNDQSEYVINYEDVTLTRKGEYFQLNLSSVVGGKVPEFSWSSDNNSVATVDSKGIVTAVGNGTANITASIGDDDFRCIVRVNID